jgi:hypothetical protein
MSARKSTHLPETTKAKLAMSTLANHWRQEMALKDPEARLAVELVLRYRTLHERFPGAPTLAQSQKQAQSGCWLWPHQLLNGN